MMLIRVMASAAALLAAMPAAAQDGGMLGDWGGLKPALADGGFNLSASVTGTTQGLLSGDGTNHWDAAARADVLLDVDFSKWGLDTGTVLKTHGEVRFFQPKGGFGGQLLPGNTGVLLPLADPGEFELTSIHLQQRIGQRSVLLLGKINTADLLGGDPFFGGYGTQRFMNMAFAAPPSGVVPPVIMGGVLIHKAGPFSITTMVFDPEDRTGQYWVKGLFKTGVNLSLGTTWSGKMGGRATSLGITGTYSTKRGQNLDDILIPGAQTTSTKKGSWNLAVQGSHLLAESAAKPGQGLGAYFKAAIADGNPNLVRASFIGGIAGHGMVRGRPDDSFGIGVFYYNLSDALQDAVEDLTEVDDEKGLEAWYSLAVTPWLKLTPDVQIIDPARGERPTAVIGAVRVHVLL